jgi:hypothetical protein
MNALAIIRSGLGDACVASISGAIRESEREAETSVQTAFNVQIQAKEFDGFSAQLEVQIIDDRFAVAVFDSVEGVEFVELVRGRHYSFTSTAV